MGVGGIGTPVLGVGTAVGLVVADDVVAGALELAVDGVVERASRVLAHVAFLEHRHQHGRRPLHEQQGRGFKGFDEALGQAIGHAVAVPGVGDAADAHLQMPRRRVGVEQPQAGPQLGFGLVRRAEAGAVDVAVAVALGQRDFPGPAVVHRGGDRLRHDRPVDRRGHGDRRIVEEVFGERHERRAQRLADQQRCETSAVDEEVGCQRFIAFESQAGDLAMFVLQYRLHVARHVVHSAFERLAVQERPQQSGVEVVAVGDVERKAALGLGSPAFVRQPAGNEEPVGVGMDVGAVQSCMHVLHELGHGQVVEHRRERMEIALEPRPGRPAIESDARLVGGVAPRHPFGFLDTQAFEEATQPWRGAFADPDGADLGGFDHRYLQAPPVGRVRQQQRGHPTRGAAADDADVLDRRLGIMRQDGALGGKVRIDSGQVGSHGPA